MFLSFLANDAVLPLKLEAFCRNPCRHKILSFLGDSLPVKLHLLVSETTKMWEKQEMLVEISCQKKKKTKTLGRLIDLAKCTCSLCTHGMVFNYQQQNQ